MTEKSEVEKKFEEIRKIGGTPKIFMNSVPRNTWIRFKEIANEEDFNENYGFALKHLIDFYDGVIGSGVEHIENAIVNLDERLRIIENNFSSKSEEKEQEKIMADGSARKLYAKETKEK